MRVKDVVARMNKELIAITKRPETFNPIHSKKVDLVSQRFVQEMREMLDLYAASEIEANENTLLPFTNQLKKYADFVLSTNAIMSHNSRTHANRLYLFIAFELSKWVDEHPYKLFLPSLQIDERNARTFDDVALDRAILSDDNHTLIDVVDAFVMGSHKKLWQHTHPINGVVDLSENEIDRLKKFTPQTFRYFNDIEANVSERKLRKSHNDMLKNMFHTRIHATYGELGEARLAVRLYPNRKSINHETLVDLLSAYPAPMRGKYLAEFGREELEKIALQSSKLENEISKSSHYKGNLKHDTAALFIWLEIYLRDIKEVRKSNYKSILGWASGMGVPRPIKEKAAEVVYDLMLKNVPLDQIKAKALEVFSTIKDIQDNERPFLNKSLDQGVLGQWVTQAESIAKPQVQSSYWFRRK